MRIRFVFLRPTSAWIYSISAASDWVVLRSEGISTKILQVNSFWFGFGVLHFLTYVPYWQHHYGSKITKRTFWLMLPAPYTNEGHCDVDPQSPLVVINIMSLCLIVNKAVHWLHPNQNWNNCSLCASANVCVRPFLVMIQPFYLRSWGCPLYSLCVGLPPSQKASLPPVYSVSVC